ncbi:MAG: N-acetylmuramoyl-L-alanine amidase [Planctomycetes bacterium]|nr:N-acetylmuramoyl-L-alanine amidase [Planctomycetota bacterium]
MRKRISTALLALSCVCLFGCPPRPGTLLQRTGDEIVVCGQLYHIGTPVRLWLDLGGYDAYRLEKRFENPRIVAGGPSPATNPAEAAKARYGSWRKHLPAEEWDSVWHDGWTPERLAEHVDQFVMHYDVCGTSQQCFKVLHDLRNLSVHFMLDVDGTIYQTLDLKERAWHATIANDRSIGIEIANIGAYDTKVGGVTSRPALLPFPAEAPGLLAAPLDKWYLRDGRAQVRLTLPESLAGGVRTAGFVGRPARPGPIVGRVHGRPLMQFDYTNEQYEALIKLTAAVHRILPRIKLDCPRDAAGEPRWDLLSADEFAAYSGLIGHYHLTTNKVDPGPAFDWERVIRGAARQ